MTTVGAYLLEDAVQRMADSRFDPTEWRMSKVGHPCDRYLVLSRLGVAQRPPDRRDLAYFLRGRIVERWVVDLYRRRYPHRVRAQFPVRLDLQPGGDPLTLTGHVDLWIVPERMILEVKSVTPAQLEAGLPREADLAQVQLYLYAMQRRRRSPRPERAELVYVSMGREVDFRVLPVAPDTEAAQRCVERIGRLEAMARARRVPPVEFWPDEYPCSHLEAGGQVRRCPFFTHCHGALALAGPDFPAAQVPDGHIGSVARSWMAAKAEERRAQEAYEQARAVRRAIEQEQILPLAEQLGNDCLIGDGYQIRVRRYPGRVSWDIDAAMLCGAVSAEALEPFRRVGEGYVTVDVRAIKGGESA